MACFEPRQYWLEVVFLLVYQVIDPHDGYKVELFVIEKEAILYQNELEKEVKKEINWFGGSKEIFRCKLLDVEEGDCALYRLKLINDAQYLSGYVYKLNLDVDGLYKVVETFLEDVMVYHDIGNELKVVYNGKEWDIYVPVDIRMMTNEKRKRGKMQALEKYGIVEKIYDIVRRSSGA